MACFTYFRDSGPLSGKLPRKRSSATKVPLRANNILRILEWSNEYVFLMRLFGNNGAIPNKSRCDPYCPWSLHNMGKKTLSLMQSSSLFCESMTSLLANKWLKMNFGSNKPLHDKAKLTTMTKFFKWQKPHLNGQAAETSRFNGARVIWRGKISIFVEFLQDPDYQVRSIG